MARSIPPRSPSQSDRHHEPRHPRVRRLHTPPLPAEQTARALRHLRWCLTRNTVRSVLSGSRLRLSMILICSAVFWLGLFGLFLGGFEFMGINDALFSGIFEYLFSMFFLSILVMLFFSTGIITYTALFHSREGAFLLSTPATTDRIFAYKFAEAIGLSSWGFFLLGSPTDGRVRNDDERSAGLLRDVPGVPDLVRPDRGEPGRDRGDRGGERVPQAPEAGARGVGGGDGGPDGGAGVRLWTAPGERSRATGCRACRTAWLSARTRSGRADGCRPACWRRRGATGPGPAIT